MTADIDTQRRITPYFRPIVLLFLLAACGLRMRDLVRQDIWWDEARNIIVALKPFTQIANAPELDIHPPVYFWLLHGWGRLSGMQIGLGPEQLAFLSRYVSVFAGVLGVALVVVLARRCGGVLAATLACVIGALSPFWLAESQEARMYTVGFVWLMAAALLLLTYTAAANRQQQVSETATVRAGWPALAGFVLLSALALLTHYNAVFILVAWYGWWLMWSLHQARRWRELGWMAAAGGATLLLALPAAPIALRQIPGYANPNLTVPSLRDYLWQNWAAYIGGYAYSTELFGGYAVLWLWLVLALAAVGAMFVAAARPPRGADLRSAEPLSLLGFWLVGGLALYYIAVLDRGAFNVRYSSFVTPSLFALLGVTFAAWCKVHGAAPLAVMAVVVAGFIPAVRADLYDPAFAREDIRGVTEWLRREAGPQDVIFVDQKYPFGLYYHRYTIDAGAEPQGDEAAPARYLFVDINHIDEWLNVWAGDARKVFWVQWFESDTDPRRAVPFLLDAAGRRGGEQEFRGYSIDWWELNPPNHFELAPNLTPAHHAFPPAVEMIEQSLPEDTVAAGGMLPVTLRWQRWPGGTVERPLKARVALYDRDDGRVAQADERLLNDRHLLPAEWNAADQPFNVYKLDVPAELVAGEYEVRVLVYDADTLEPLGTVDKAGNPAGVEATLGTVTIGPAAQED